MGQRKLRDDTFASELTHTTKKNTLLSSSVSVDQGVRVRVYVPVTAKTCRSSQALPTDESLGFRRCFR